MKIEEELRRALHREADQQAPYPGAWSRFQGRRRRASAGRSILVAAAAALLIAGAFTVPRVLSERRVIGVETPGPSRVDSSARRTYRDPIEGWSMQYPSGWRLQEFDETLRIHVRGLLVSNVVAEFSHPEIPNGATTEWDMRRLPEDAVVIEFALSEGGPAPPPTPPPDTKFPLSLSDAMPENGPVSGSTYGPAWQGWPRFVSVDHAGRRYGLRVWIGPRASETDRKLAERAVASISFAEPASNSPAGAGTHARAVVYTITSPHNEVDPTQEPGIWLYETETDRATQLLAFSKDRRYSMPRFRNEKEVSFVAHSVAREPSRDSLELIDIGTGARRVLADLGTASLLDCDWRPDGDAIACIETDYYAEPAAVHKLVVRALDGSGRTLRELGTPPGSDCCRDDEISVTWSRDGRSLLVVDTSAHRFVGDRMEQTETVYLMDPSGRDLVDPMLGTQASLSPDDRNLYMREWHGSGEPGRWFAVELATGKRTALAMRSTGYEAVLSPDGRYIGYLVGRDVAFQAGEADDGLFLYDLRSGSDRKIASGYQGPVWFGPGVVAATKVERCSGCNVVEGWLGRGGWTIPISGARRERLTLGSTLFGSVDVLYQ